jgi:CDP-diacylglycerol--glycerol-3-phosphate 3-phosphatidyltransferase
MVASLWTVPNMLTYARVIAAPGVALAFVALPRPMADWVALVLFVLAALTDYVDGWLARRWNQLSDIGRVLDPIADKAMVAIALAVLAALHGLSGWVLLPAAAILLRETLVSGLREALSGRATLPVTLLAKWKTTAQLVAIALMLAPVPAQGVGMPGVSVGLAGLALLWVAAGLTLVTGWDYCRRALPHLAD